MTNTFYAGLKDIKGRLGITDTDDDSRLLDAIEDASRGLDLACGRAFYPRIASFFFDYDSEFELQVNEDLLSVSEALTSFDDGSGSEVTSSQYHLMCGDSYNIQPYDRLIIDQSTSANFDFNYTPHRSQKITGVWGYHNDYDNAFFDSGQTLGADINATATTISVSNATPFSAGQTIKIGSEWMHIVYDSFKVERGINGSTAATHSSGDAIYIYKPIKDVSRIAARYALWLYKQDEAPFTFEVQTGPDGSFYIPQDAPPEIHRFVKRYRRTH